MWGTCLSCINEIAYFKMLSIVSKAHMFKGLNSYLKSCSIGHRILSVADGVFFGLFNSLETVVIRLYQSLLIWKLHYDKFIFYSGFFCLISQELLEVIAQILMLMFS